MTTVTLDSIVMNFIMKRGYTIHRWMPFMVYATECLRTLSEDDLKVINTMLLPVGDYNEVELPDDYLDYVLVGVRAGQNVKPLVETSKLNPLINRSSDFSPIPYANSEDNAGNQIYYGTLYPFYWNTVAWNSYGEPTGRFFGLGAGSQDDVFSVFPERNQIQLTENLSCTEIVLQYISDGMNSNAATQITPYAFETISAYIMWQMMEHTRTYSTAEAERARQLYIGERQILRARKSDLTKEVFTRIVQRGRVASPK